MRSVMNASITCPRCRTAFTTRVHDIVDVGREPGLKQALLQGQVNVATCPSCGQTGMLVLPFLYHDPDKDLLLIFLPDQLSMKPEERERRIGSLVNKLMDTIPPEQRKSYLFNPQTFMTFERLIEAILSADGITPEMIEAQRRAVMLIDDLFAAKDEPDRLKQLVEEHKEEIDYEFLLLLSSYMEALAQAGNTEQAEAMSDLRDKILALVPMAVPSAGPQGVMDRDQLLEHLINAKDDQELEVIVALNRPMIDYIFFQKLTERIESQESGGQSAEAARLKTLREKLLDVTQRMDKEVQKAQEETVGLIEELLSADDLPSAIAAHRNDLDTLFFFMLANMTRQAQQDGDTELVDKLTKLRAQVISFLEEQMPPHVRVINRLLTAAYPEETMELLTSLGEGLDAELVAGLREIAEDLEEQHHEGAAQKLRQVADQAETILLQMQRPPAQAA